MTYQEIVCAVREKQNIDVQQLDVLLGPASEEDVSFL